MAIQLEFYCVIVPIKNIIEKLGKDVFTETYALNTDWCWHDKHLYCEGCMEETSLGELLDDWESKGFSLVKQVNGEDHWHELCVVYSHDGPSCPCDWIEYDAEKEIVWLKGTEPGTVIGPDHTILDHTSF